MNLIFSSSDLVFFTGRHLGQTDHPLKATLSNQSLHQQGTVEPSSRLAARAMKVGSQWYGGDNPHLGWKYEKLHS